MAGYQSPFAKTAARQAKAKAKAKATGKKPKGIVSEKTSTGAGSAAADYLLNMFKKK